MRHADHDDELDLVEELFIFEVKDDWRPPSDRDQMHGWYYVLNEDFVAVFGPFGSEAAAKFDARCRIGGAPVVTMTLKRH